MPTKLILHKTIWQLLWTWSGCQHKKSRSNKTPVERPDKFLEVVHCNIGFGDGKSIGNGALYCLTLVDRATRYSWIYPLKSLHHESLKCTFQHWITDCGGCPTRLYTDFDPKRLDGQTACFFMIAILYFEVLLVVDRIKMVLSKKLGRLPPIWQGLL